MKKIVLLFLLLPITSLAEETGRFKADLSSCGGYRLGKKTWVPLKSAEIKALVNAHKSVKISKSWENKPELVYAQIDGKKFALSIACFEDEKAPTPVVAAPISPTPVAHPSPKPVVKKGTSYFQIGFSSWQETLKLKGPDVNSPGNQVDLITNPFGLCAGFGYRKRLSGVWSWDLNSCVFLGSGSSTLSSSSAGSGYAYDTKKTFVLGLNSSVGFLWNPPREKQQFGIGLPILIRHANWSAPSGDQITPTTALHSGALVESRFYTNGRTCLNPKISWLQTTHTILWSFNLNWNL